MHSQNIMYRPGHPNLDFHTTYAFIKKSTIFTFESVTVIRQDEQYWP